MSVPRVEHDRGAGVSQAAVFGLCDGFGRRVGVEGRVEKLIGAGIELLVHRLSQRGPCPKFLLAGWAGDELSLAVDREVAGRAEVDAMSL